MLSRGAFALGAARLPITGGRAAGGASRSLVSPAARRLRQVRSVPSREHAAVHVRRKTTDTGKVGAVKTSQGAVGVMGRLVNALGNNRLAVGYSSLMDRRPVPTKMVTALTLYGLGDVLAQGVQDKPFDAARVARAAGFGFFVAGAANHYHFQLCRYLTMRFNFVPGSVPAVVGSVFLDQLVYFSYFMTVAYHIFTSLTTGQTLDESIETMRTHFWPTMKANWAFWPIVQVVNFALVPIKWQTNVVLTASLCWAVCLSVMFGDKTADSETTVAVEELA